MDEMKYVSHVHQFNGNKNMRSQGKICYCQCSVISEHFKAHFLVTSFALLIIVECIMMH